MQPTRSLLVVTATIQKPPGIYGKHPEASRHGVNSCAATALNRQGDSLCFINRASCCPTLDGGCEF